MVYDYLSDFGDNTYFVPCGLTFLGEVANCVALGLLDVTNAGQEGNSLHLPTSRHSPHWANGHYWIAAADFEGNDYPKLADFWQYMYKQHDDRLYPYAFCQWGDGYGLEWFTGNREWTGKDQGHTHLDFAMRTANPQDPNWWVPSLASTRPWGLEDWLRGGNTNVPVDNVEDDMYGDADRARDVQTSQNVATSLATARDARRLMQVFARTRPPRSGELLPALAPGKTEPQWLFGLIPTVKYGVGTRLWSGDGMWNLTVQSDGNLVLYSAYGAGVWASKSSGANAQLVLQADGNLVLYSGTNVLWSTRTHSGATLALQTDGNLVLRDASGAAVWNTGTHTA